MTSLSSFLPAGQDFHPDQLVGMPVVCAVADMTRRTVERMIAAQKMPQPIRSLSSRRLKWRWSTIKNWLHDLEVEAARNVA